MSAALRVAVLVPSWNGREHLETCLAALAAQETRGFEWQTWVLDNGSTDGTGAWLRSEHPDIRVVESALNLGFAAGMNHLVKACDADAVALLNNDTRPHPDWLATLVDGLRSAPEDVAAVSGQIVDWEGERLDFGRGVMTFDGHAFQLDCGRPLATATCPAAGEELLFACGGNMIAWRERFQAVGGFDDDYFAYFEDVDLGWRWWAAGDRILAATDAVVHHRSAGTSGRLGNERRGVLFERNAFLTAYKNYDAEHWQRLEPAILLALLARTSVLLVANNPRAEVMAADPYAVAAGAASPAPEPGIWQKLVDYGPRESVGRAIRKLGRMLAGVDGQVATGAPVITDPRTIAQFQAVSYLLGHLDEASDKRRRIQGLRRRSDAEIFERFPLYLVPTYPGDEALFASSGFRSWLPKEPELVEASLAELMAIDE